MRIATILVAAGVCVVGWAILALAGLLLLRARRLDRVVRAAGLVYLLVAGGGATANTIPSVGEAVAYRGLPTAFFVLVLGFLAFGLLWPWLLYWQMVGDA